MRSRTVTLVGGPSAGSQSHVFGTPEHICTRKPARTGEWHTYRRIAADMYEHAGPCGDRDHMHNQPGSDDCCCGDPNCRDREERLAAMGIDPAEVEQVETVLTLRPRVP